MSNGLFQLAEELKGLNDNLQSRRRERADRSALRAGLETAVGEFRQARKLSEDQVRDLFGGRGLVGCDGSVNQVGGNYPYTIHLFKSLAKSSLKNSNGQSAVEKVRLFTPLQSASHRMVRELMEARRNEIRVEPQDEREVEAELAEAQAYLMLCDQIMVEMELEAAMEAMERFDPRLLLMDGGFSRLKGKGGDKWEQFAEMALDRNTIIVGVIEEVGSYRLKSRLDEVSDALLEGFVRGHDREILFNTMEEGEWLKTFFHRPIKNEFYTVFNRLSDQPQAGACDFLREQAEGELVEGVLDYLYTITPAKSRGIPLWLDLVDAEVRLTKKQIDMIVGTNIDLENIETFLRPQRERRDF